MAKKKSVRLIENCNNIDLIAAICEIQINIILNYFLFILHDWISK